MTSFAVVIPWRTDHGRRERLWRWVEWSWNCTGIPFYAASDGRSDGDSFNRSMARNNAFRASSEDIVILADADHIPQPLAVADVMFRMGTGLPWAPVFATNGVFTNFETESILHGDTDPLKTLPKPHMTTPFCTSPIAVRREVYQDVGGFPEAYEGWGGEDTEFRATLQALYPIGLEANASLMNLCLFHEFAKDAPTWEDNLARIHRFEDVLAQGTDAVRDHVRSRSSL